MKGGEDLLSTETVLKALGMQIIRLREHNDKCNAEDESLCVLKLQIIGNLMRLFCPKRCEKATKKLSKHIEQQHIDIPIHIEPKFNG